MQIELTAADGHRLSAYRAGPQDAKRALVVVQEIFGVNRHMHQRPSLENRLLLPLGR